MRKFKLFILCSLLYTNTICAGGYKLFVNEINSEGLEFVFKKYIITDSNETKKRKELEKNTNVYIMNPYLSGDIKIKKEITKKIILNSIKSKIIIESINKTLEWGKINKIEKLSFKKEINNITTGIEESIKIIFVGLNNGLFKFQIIYSVQFAKDEIWFESNNENELIGIKNSIKQKLDDFEKINDVFN